VVRILVSGAFGFIGSPLTSFFSSIGHEVVPLVRNSDKKTSAIIWDPERELANPEDFEGFDAVFHLAGEPLTFSRWSHEKKKKIFDSRVQGTSFLSRTLASLDHPPKLFLSASACGFYGDRKEEILTEKSEAGRGFLAEVCSAWEEASFAIAKRGSRVVHTRFGIVLGPNGGSVQKMLPFYKLGFGGKLGSGKQWMSWIALQDLIRALVHILQNESLQGPVNVVSPHPVRQEIFAKTLAELLHRPSFFHSPAWALRLGLGATADELLLGSSRVQPVKLLESNFLFQYPDVRSALLNAL